MVRLTHLRFAAAALAIAAVALAGSPARAFTFQSLDGSASGSARFADPDDAVKNSGNGGPKFELNAGPGSNAPFGRFQNLSPGPRPPDPYGPRSLGNND
jgi:hypothetical protein